MSDFNPLPLEENANLKIVDICRSQPKAKGKGEDTACCGVAFTDTTLAFL